MAGRPHLGPFEEHILLAILQLREGAHAPVIARLLEDRADRRISRGALYATLDRLESKGLLEWSEQEGSARRGGRRKRLFRVTAQGVREVAASREALLALWNGLEEILAGALPR